MKLSNKLTGVITVAIVTLGCSSLSAMASGTDQPAAEAANAASGAAGVPLTGDDIHTSPDVSVSVNRSLLQAQTETGQNPPTVTSVSAAPPSEGHPPRKGPLSGIGDALEARGINLRLLLTNLAAANPSTGISTGKSTDYFTLFMGADVDLEKLVGIPNTRFHITEAWEPPSHNTVSFTTQTGSAFTPLVQQTTTNDLIKFTLSHDLFEKRLHVEYGRMNLTDDFFLSSMCAGCVVSTPAITLNVPGITKSLWGARVAYLLSSHTRLGLGVVEDNSTLFMNSTGWNWSTRSRTGVIGIANVMYTTDFSDTRYPLNAEAGVYHNTSPYTDDLHNVDGSSQVLNPSGTALKHGNGTWGFYGQARKVIWTAPGSEGPVPPNVALYGGAFITPGPGQSFPVEAYGGAEYGGFLRNNPAALVGSVIRYIQLSRGRALYEQQLSTVSGWSRDGVNRNTFSFDVHAQYGLAPGVLVNGFAQYLLHPNRMHPLAATGSTRSGWMIGLSLLIDLGRVTGLTSP
ncbi:carbohydrate porin [Paraburkholderia phenoliruptrix]|uniref:carbohydrate porin n=1 Tax=Paraburkholderia phenoliruptrix TaxID=252970 RepID=UPI0001C028D9|nr:carbohydrate porin [Paraburkholderia phenoliruptrix]MDR6390898.1 porin [Paraburkholderia phenoliruptrix]WMY11878.1 carbohydrate porin [Paraburkholderia phenoliruptrix]